MPWTSVREHLAFRGTVPKKDVLKRPHGRVRDEPFQQGTIAVAQAVAEATDKGAYSLVGGGDSVAP